MDQAAPPPPHERYRRALAGADFSLDANAEAVPSDGRFYVLKGGKPILETEDFPEALTEYNRLCKDHWAERLDSEDVPVRIQAAWGLLGLEPTDKEAQAVINRDGTPQEKKRLEQMQSRRRALRSRQAAGKSS